MGTPSWRARPELEPEYGRFADEAWQDGVFVEVLGFDGYDNVDGVETFTHYCIDCPHHSEWWRLGWLAVAALIAGIGAGCLGVLAWVFLRWAF